MKSRFIVVSTFVVVILVNLYFRSFPAFFPQFKKSAAEVVYKSAYEEIALDVEKRYPGLPVQAKARLVNSMFEEHKKANAGAMRGRLRDEYLRQKDMFQDKRGQTYLMELDCWHWARYVENVLEKGYPGDTMSDGVAMDTFMKYPDGIEMGWSNFLFYASAGLYRFFSLFYPLPLYQFLFYLPLLFMAVFIGVVFFFCYRFYGLLCAFVSCLFIGLSPIFLPRSVAGWFDMDVLNQLIPFLAVVCYLYSFEKQGRSRMLWLTASALWTGIFAYTWSYWFVFPAIIMAYEFFMLANLQFERLQYKSEVSQESLSRALSLAAFLVLSFFSVILFAGTAPFKYLAGQVAQSLRLNDAVVSVWPNVFSTVGELKRPDLITIARSSGDVLLFGAALVAMLVMLLSGQRARGFKRNSFVMFTIWFLAMFLVCSKGVRFVMFLLVPLGIVLGWGLEQAFALAERKKNTLGIVLCVAGLLYTSFSCLSIGYKTSLDIFPLMNDQWYSLLGTIKKETPEGSVINSWWDYGDWFKTVGGRPVIFDGQSQEGARAYWMARALLTDDDEESAAILRMLNNGGNRAFELLDTRLKDQFLSLKVLKELLACTREEGRERLGTLLPPEEAGTVESLLYDIPRHKAYLVVDSTMLMKLPAISSLGNWDASKVLVARDINRSSAGDIRARLERIGVSPDEAERLTLEASLITRDKLPSWISSRWYFHGSFARDKEEDGRIFFSNGSIYNLSTRKVDFYDVEQQRFRTPSSVFVVEDGRIGEFKFPGDMKTAAVIFNGPGDCRLMLFTADAVRSVFFRLNFLQGKGSSRFRPFCEEKGVASVYEVVW